MEGVGASSSSSAPATDGQMSVMSSLKKNCLSFGVSLQQGFRYFKAFLFGQAKQMTARSEQEASEADLMVAKMQVEAADAAEVSKTNLQLEASKSN